MEKHRFSDWLSSGSAGSHCTQGNRCNYILIRVEKNADFEYLYCQKRYDEGDTIIECGFSICRDLLLEGWSSL